MSVDSFIKRSLFWINDACHGNKIRKHYNQIKKSMNDFSYGKKCQQENLNSILKHATEHTAFYKSFQNKPLSEFPVVNKSILIENYDKNIVPVEFIPKQETDKVHIQKTSGSTGTPFAVYQDSRKRNRRIAELKWFGEMVGYKSHERLAQCRIWTNWQRKTKKQIYKENIFPIDVSKMDDKTMDEICDTVLKNKIVALRAYASWYDNLLQYFNKKSGSINAFKTVKVMFSTSESLNYETKKEFMEKFNIPIVECYADEEAGILAHQKIGDDRFYLNNASYYFEFLKLEEDIPAEYGEVSRIILTDLFNYAFPLIRYDTGDTAIVEKGDYKSNGWDYINQLYGRRLDMVYDVSGNPIHPMSFSRVLKNLNGIIQWQFIQKEKDSYLIKINSTEDFDEKLTTNAIKEIVGKKANVIVEYVNEIPVLSSGKRKSVICELSNNG